MPLRTFGKNRPQPDKAAMRAFEKDFVEALALDGGEVVQEVLERFLRVHFGPDPGAELMKTIDEDVAYFRGEDPASKDYSTCNILSVRRGMVAVAAHRVFHRILKWYPNMLFEIEIIAKYVQKDTNVEIHPMATIGVPFGIDHGHGTVIGATTILGKRVFIYHGVTLGATGRRSRTDRRHPMVGDDVFFGNGSQIIGPAIVGKGVRLASGVIIKECHLQDGSIISPNVRMSTVIVPPKTHVYGADTEDHYRYWVQLGGEDKAKWVQFGRFEVSKID
jgi:serine acetyltransferase